MTAGLAAAVQEPEAQMPCRRSAQNPGASAATALQAAAALQHQGKQGFKLMKVLLAVPMPGYDAASWMANLATNGNFRGSDMVTSWHNSTLGSTSTLHLLQGRKRIWRGVDLLRPEIQVANRCNALTAGEQPATRSSAGPYIMP
jgi:hypothetical protein